MAQVDLDTDDTSAADDLASPEAPFEPGTRFWLLVMAIVPLLAFWEGFSLSRVFYVRDLSFYYWPVHVWARRTLLSGELPLWDPYPGLGQSAIGEAARHLLFPPAVLFRVLLPDALGFNLFVAAASAAGAVGMFLFLRKDRSASGAAFGALVFALSGPILSLGNMPNHAWTIALTPWCFLAAREIAKGTPIRGLVGLAVATGLQALAAEPVSMAVTSGLCVLFAATISESRSRAARAAGLALAGSAAGFALAAAQTVPLLDAVLRSQRAAVVSGNVLPVHPLALVETLAWPIFGNPFDRWDAASPWLRALNGEGDPYLFSLYVGAGALAVAAGGAVAGWRARQSWFWIACAVVCTVLALGVHTPVYPALREIVPVFTLFRYPSKYFCFGVFAIAALAARGWETIGTGPAGRHARSAIAVTLGGAAVVGLAVWLASLVAEGGLARAVAGVAERLGVAEPYMSVPAVQQSMASGAFRLLLVTVVIGGLALAARRWESRERLLRAALFALIVADLFSVNSAVNPTFDASVLGTPDWVGAIRSAPAARTYLPGRIDFYFPDSREEGYGPMVPELRQLTTQQASAVTNVRFAAFPAEARVREAVSMDLTSIWPRDYKFMILRYGNSTGADRIRFLERSGVRFFLLQRPPPGGQLVGTVELSNLSVFERAGASPRASIATHAEVRPDVEAQIDALFLPDVDPSQTVVLGSEPPPPAGAESAPGDGSVRIVDDGGDRLGIVASAPEGGGYLLLRDSWDPYWTATVDGQPAEVLRAYGLFRAVRLAPGEHEVVFAYRPTPFYAGCAVSAVTAALLLGLWLVSRRRARETGILPRHGEETVR
jgi:hypothetical protein